MTVVRSSLSLINDLFKAIKDRILSVEKSLINIENKYKQNKSVEEGGGWKTRKGYPDRDISSAVTRTPQDSLCS